MEDRYFKKTILNKQNCHGSLISYQPSKAMGVEKTLVHLPVSETEGFRICVPKHESHRKEKCSWILNKYPNFDQGHVNLQ